jgi:hypothetical protein
VDLAQHRLGGLQVLKQPGAMNEVEAHVGEGQLGGVGLQIGRDRVLGLGDVQRGELMIHAHELQRGKTRGQLAGHRPDPAGEIQHPLPGRQIEIAQAEGGGKGCLGFQAVRFVGARRAMDVGGHRVPRGSATSDYRG